VTASLKLNVKEFECLFCVHVNSYAIPSVFKVRVLNESMYDIKMCLAIALALACI